MNKRIVLTVTIACIVWVSIFTLTCTGASGKPKEIAVERNYAIGYYDTGERPWGDPVAAGIYIEMAFFLDGTIAPGVVGSISREVEDGDEDWNRVVPIQQIESLVPEWALGNVSLVSEKGCISSQAQSGYVEIDDWLGARMGLIFPTPVAWLGQDWTESTRASLITSPSLAGDQQNSLPALPSDLPSEYADRLNEYSVSFSSDIRAFDGGPSAEPSKYGWLLPGQFEGGAAVVFYSLVGMDGAVGVVEVLDDQGNLAYTMNSWEEELDELSEGYWSAYEPLFAFDVDQDGLDEIVVNEFYHEGSCYVLWKGSPEGVEKLASGVCSGA